MDFQATSGAKALTRLTPAQHEAVFADDPRLAVFAGAGAGKTRVLTLRAARLVDDGADPAHLLVVTFSRKAAQELRQRLWRLGVEGVRAGTFHATALELLEISRAERGQAPPKLISDRRKVLERVAAKVPTIRGTNVGLLLDSELTWAKSLGLTPVEYRDAAQRTQRQNRLDVDAVALVWDAYEQNKRRQGYVDFDDLILEAAVALDDPRFADAIHWRSRHILVDEFQDVNPSQFDLVTRLLTPSTTLFCVGDPNQSIYGFNGATPSLLRNLETTLPGTRIIVLDANHRSTPEIVSAATSVLSPEDRRDIHATQQSGTLPELIALDDDVAEAAWVARRALRTKEPGGKWRSMAILARTNAQLARFEEACNSLGIPTERLAPEQRLALEIKADADAPRPGGPSEAPRDAIALGTFHRAKGLEWPTVFVTGVSEGFVPHLGATNAEALDEERRLLYVALTRAERRLFVTWAARKDGEESSRAPARRRSRFLDEFERHLEVLKGVTRGAPSANGAVRAGQLRQLLEDKKNASTNS